MYLYKYDITSFILTMSIFFQIVILLIVLSKKWVFDEKRKKNWNSFPYPRMYINIKIHTESSNSRV